MPGRTIIRAYTRRYRDNGQTAAYVEWSDGSRTTGHARGPRTPFGPHTTALFDRAAREGVPITHEVW